MIINNLMGGLCNQLFQIAAGFAHSKKMGTDYAINYKIGNGSGQGYHHTKYKKNIYKNIPETDRNIFIPYKEPRFSYCPILPMNNLCLTGYFQSKKYFENYQSDIKELFAFPKPLTEKISEKLLEIKKRKVGIHLRLGDYCHARFQDVFFKVDYSSYLEKVILNFDENCEFLVFSDDLKSLSQIIDLSKFVLLNNENEIEDLFSLSQCDDIIMSNSSFSWWGTFLGKKKDRVFCPDKWFGSKGPQDPNDLYEDWWTKIHV